MDKLCTDCAHSTPRYSNITFCLHADNVIVSKVDGEKEFERSCSALRESEKHCGAGAKWWSAK